MSLEISLVTWTGREVFDKNITHNLNKMANAAGLYTAIWRPDEAGLKRAWQLIPLLESGIKNLESDPEHYRQFEPANKWGTYETLLAFAQRYLDACKKVPFASVNVY